MKPLTIAGLALLGLGAAYVTFRTVPGDVGTTVRVPLGAISNDAGARLERLFPKGVTDLPGAKAQDLLVQVTSVSGDLITGFVTGARVSVPLTQGLTTVMLPPTVSVTFARAQILA